MKSRRVLVSPDLLPRFWIFMYRVTPITYFINALVSTGISGVEVTCTTEEILQFDPPSGQSCSAYLADYINEAGGRLFNADATQECQFCPVSSTDSLIARLGIDYGDRWRNFGITLVYSIFNVAGALLLYWSFRVPKGVRREKA
jgi:ATP-binding cassette, subfamily G (WHITE), member 2, PDR